MEEERRESEAEELNSKTEEILGHIKKRSGKDLHDKDVEELISELQLYQSQLEMQVEKLQTTQENLEELRRQYFDLYNFAPVGYFTISPESIIKEVNLTGSEMLGVPPGMLKGAGLSNYVTSGSRDLFSSHLLALGRTKEKQSCEIKIRTVDRREFWAEIKSTPILSSFGDVETIRTTIIDISERKKREEVEHRLTGIMQNSAVAIILQDLSGNILAWNKGAKLMYGYTEKEAQLMNMEKLLPSHKRQEMDEILKKLQQGSNTLQMDTQRVTRSGNIVHVHSSYSLQYDMEGIPTAISSIENDITESKKFEADRKRLIRQLAGEQKVLEAIINQLPVGVMIAEPPDGKVIIKNSLIDKIFGYELGLPQSYKDYGTQITMLHPDGRPYAREELPLVRTLKFGEKVENEIATFRRGDGTMGMMSVNASPVREPNGEIIAGIAILQDATSRIEEEKKVLESRDFADNIIMSMGDGLLVIDENMRVVRCNLSYGKIFKVNPEDVKGKPFSELGSQIWNIPELQFLVKRLFEEAKSINDYEVIRVFPEIGRRIVIISGRPILGREEKPSLILLAFKDVTRQRIAEEEIQRLNAMLLKRYVELQNVNRELEAFTYSVSHDLRGPLRAMEGFSRILEEEYSSKLDEKGRHYIERVCSGADSMSQLIDDLLRLSRISQTSIEYAEVNLSRIAAEFANELKTSAPDRKVTFKIQQNLIAMGDHSLLRQLIENLIRNAWKYSRETKESVIEFSMTEIEGEKTYFVRDNGAGFDMKYANKLFMPFQRLHSSEEYSGTGIGLSIVKRIVDGHDGKIWAKAKEGDGATFYFTLGSREDL